jgi:hypothetical protein
MTYRYLGDRNTDPQLKNLFCMRVINRNSKCIRGKNGNMLVEFPGGKKVVVVARLLRKVNSY